MAEEDALTSFGAGAGGERVLQVMPEMGLVARAGREFPARAAHYLAAGVPGASSPG